MPKTGQNTGEKLVVIMRGVSGAGKTTYARRNFPGAVFCSADDYMVDSQGQYRFNPDSMDQAHHLCYHKFISWMESGKAPLIVVDNTNTHLWEFEHFILTAHKHGYYVRVVHVVRNVARAQRANVHGVPVEKIRLQAERFQDAPPSWNEEVVEMED